MMHVAFAHIQFYHNTLLFASALLISDIIFITQLYFVQYILSKK